jgi:hypothetical protein
VVRLANRGDVGDRGDSQALSAPSSDRTITLFARATLGAQNFHPDTGGTTFDTCTYDHTFTVSLRVSITSMPG